MSNQLPVDIISHLEQFEASLVNFAPIIASYYKALITNGVPEPLAAQLTTEWHNFYWNGLVASSMNKK